MRNPFSRKKQASAHPVNVGKLREHMVPWSLENDVDENDPAYKKEMNRAILELAVEAENDPQAREEEGEWMLFIVDEDGYVLKEDGKYLMPDEDRQGNAWAYVGEDIAFAFSERFKGQ